MSRRIKQRRLIALLIVLAILPTLCVSAAPAQQSDDDKLTVEEGLIRVKDGQKLSGAVIIPETLNDTEVHGIAMKGFAGQDEITSVTMPDCITEIGDLAFYDCSSLKSISLSRRLTAIPAYCFDGCVKLEEIVIPSSVKKIRSYAFAGCKSLKSVELSGIYWEWANMSSFGGCDSLSDVYYAYKGKTEAPAYVFGRECNFHFDESPSGINMVGYDKDGFYIRTSGVLTATSDTIVAQKSDVFIIPQKVNGQKVESIERFWPEFQESTRVVLPDGLERIEAFAINKIYAYHDLGISELVIPKSVKYIHPLALDKGIKDIYYSGTAEEWNELDVNIYPGQTVHCADRAVKLLCDGVYYISESGKLRALTPLSSDVVIPERVAGVRVRSIAPYAFMDMLYFKKEDVLSVTLPEGLERIDPHAFNSCTGMISVSIPSTVTYIGESAFLNCRSLEKVDPLPSIKEIPDSCFFDCFSLESLELPDTVTRICNSAFEGSGIHSIYLNNVVDVGENAFLSSGLSQITIGRNVSCKKYCAFDASKLEKIYVSAGVKGNIASLGKGYPQCQKYFACSESEFREVNARYSSSKFIADETYHFNFTAF